jgi:hypothetical protein
VHCHRNTVIHRNSRNPEQVVVLTDCAKGAPNCALAHAKALVGMGITGDYGDSAFN